MLLKNFLYDMIDDIKYCRRVIETEFNKPLFMTSFHEAFEKST